MLVSTSQGLLTICRTLCIPDERAKVNEKRGERERVEGREGGWEGERGRGKQSGWGGYEGERGREGDI